MARFLTIGYGDEAGYDRTDASVRDAAHEHGAYLRSDLPVAGFSLIEAADLEAAVALAARTPCAVAYGVVEVWPLETPS